MKRCIRCLEYKEPEEFDSSWYTKKNGKASTISVCRECRNLDTSIRRCTKWLKTHQPDDVKYQKVKEKLDAFMDIEHLYELRGGKIPQRGVDKHKKKIEELEARKKQLEALILEEKQKMEVE